MTAVARLAVGFVPDWSPQPPRPEHAAHPGTSESRSVTIPVNPSPEVLDILQGVPWREPEGEAQDGLPQ